jgi:hypothetical protein
MRCMMEPFLLPKGKSDQSLFWVRKTPYRMCCLMESLFKCCRNGKSDQSLFRNEKTNLILGTFRSATNPEYELRLTSSLSTLAAFVSGRFVSFHEHHQDFSKVKTNDESLSWMPQVTSLAYLTHWICQEHPGIAVDAIEMIFMSI